MPASVIIGKDIETNQPIQIGDIERCGGLYILGKPRTGKSTLLISLALQDIEHGHGLLFIDPHADAINEILDRLPTHRDQDVILLDPTDETHAFSVNVLACANPKSLKERNITFSSALDIFIKLFPNPQTGALDILLSKYLRNSFYPMIENQGYTLADIPPFLTEKPFRESLLQRVSYNPEVVNFWHQEFEQLPRRDQREEIESTLNRLNPLLTRDYTKYLVSQPHNTVDFARWMDTRKIVLLRLPAWLDDEMKSFIGTILISQLLKAAFLRAEDPPQERILFAVYCDEFHLFASPDFAKLFTQTGKFNLMPTVAHQERLGQLKPYDPNLGATLAAPHKILFSQTVHDSRELAPELAKLSPTEIRLERQLVISQEPFQDLLRGHKHPEIHRFVQQYLRPLHYELEDTHEDIEGERLVRQALLDEAAISRTEERREAFYNSLARGRMIPVSFSELERTKQTLEEARHHTDTLLRLYDSARALKLSIRSLNTFLTAIMEGRIQPEPGQELFSQFLLAFVPLAAPLPKAVAPAFALYISLVYGNPSLPRPTPITLAAKYQGASHEELYREVEAQYTRQVLAYAERVRRDNEQRIASALQDQYEAMLTYVMTWKRRHSGFDFTEQRTRERFQLLQYRPVRALLTPYFFAKFTPPWYYEDHRPSAQIGEARLEEGEDAAVFIRQYGEGAWVTLTLLDIASKGWGYHSTNYIEPRNGVRLNRADTYQNMHMLEIPAIAGKEPFSVWQLIRKLAVTLVQIGAKPLFSITLDYYTYYVGNHSPVREDSILLSQALQKREESATPGTWWSNLDIQARKYLIFRACDIVEFGEVVADRTFPQPTLPGTSPQQVSAAVTALMMVLLEAQGRVNAAQEQAWVQYRDEFVRECLWKYDGLLRLQVYQAEGKVHMLEVATRSLPPRVLTAAERITLTDACHKELSQVDARSQRALAALEAFVQFCRLLRLPENHVRGVSTQYVEKEVNTYPTQEMINQMAQELVNLPRYTAYATLMQEQAGIQVVRKAKITTEELPKVPSGRLAKTGETARHNAIEAGILRPRRAIEAETRRRRDRWRQRAVEKPPPPSEEPPPTQIRSIDPPAPEEPPPSHNSLEKTPRDQQSSIGNKQERYAALREKLRPIIKQALARYEEQRNIQLAACCAFALKDAEAAKRLIPQLLATEDKSYWVYAGQLMAMVGDIANAEKLVHAAKYAGVGNTSGYIALAMPDKTLARSLMREYAEKGYRSSAGYLAAELGDQEVAQRVLRAYAAEMEVKRNYYHLHSYIIIDLVKYAPDVGKRLIRFYEEDKQMLRAAGQMAAELGDTATANAYIEAFKNAGEYQSAAHIAARGGEGATTAEMIWKLKQQGKDWSYDINDIVSTLARHNIEAAVELIIQLDKQGHDFWGWHAGVLAYLESLLLSEEPPPTQMRGSKSPEAEEPLSIAEKPSATLALQLESLTFFESGKGVLQKELRFYRLWFPKDTTRYLNYELTIRNRLFKHRNQTCNVVVHYYKPDGSLMATNLPYDWVITSDTEQPSLTCGRGWDEPGYWEPGDYRVQILIDGVEFAEGSFKIQKPRQRRG